MHDVAWGGRERAHGGRVPRVPRGGYAPVHTSGSLSHAKFGPVG